MKPHGIHLRYTFESLGQQGAEIENPLFDLLSALQQQGSISQAATALELSYRHVWGALKHWEDVLGQPLVVWAKGRNARLTPFAERLVWAERQARARMAPHVEALRAELHRVFALAQDTRLPLLDTAASHDLALPRLQALAEAETGVHMSLRFSGSEEALRSLLDGRCTLAGFHVPRLGTGARDPGIFAQALRPLLKPGTHKLIGSHWRRQGLMFRPDPGGAFDGVAPGELLAALAQGRGRFVHRQAGSGTRLLLNHLLQAAGLDGAAIDAQATLVEHTHLAVAAAVAAGKGDAGLGIEAAAHAFGLSFWPLADEDYFLVCLKPALELPAVQALRTVLAGSAWQQAVGQLPGYGVQRPGEVLSLTRALPWWNDRAPRRAGRAGGTSGSTTGNAGGSPGGSAGGRTGDLAPAPSA